MPLLPTRFRLHRHEPVPKRHHAAASVQWGWLALIASAHATGLGLLLDPHRPAPSASASVMQVHLLTARPPIPASPMVTPAATLPPRPQRVENRARRTPAPRAATSPPPLPESAGAAALAEAAAPSPATQALSSDAPQPAPLQAYVGAAGGQGATTPLPPLPYREADYLDNPAPAYPGSARRLGEEGMVVLRVHVLRDGRAREIEILAPSGSTRLDQAASDAVRRWRFRPARVGEERVDSWLRVPVVFRLEH